MKQIAQNYKSGELAVLDVPAPTCRPGGVLVRSLFSLISTGTEMMKVNEASMSMVGMARARPDQVRKVLDQVQQQGVVTTYKKVMNKLDSYTPLGYSLCGVVTEVGKGAEEFKVGQLVACAGNEQALHAEYNFVPVNLCAAVPDGVSPEHAAFATVASIAMHGVRRAEVQLGETAVVIGLGLIGQLVVRLLVAAGVQAVGVDPVDARCRLAEKAGAALAGSPSDLDTLVSGLAAITSGRGADHIFLAAGGHTNGPVEAAVKLARDRARVVDIGKMKLDLPWNAYYEKELDVRFSRSYGPGRYDSRYELEGIDYPVGYVRWTEKRNLESFLELLARNSLEVASLIDGVFPFSDAAKVYGDLKDGTLKAVGVLLEYEQPADGAPKPATSKVLPGAKSPSVRNGSKDKSEVRIGFVGAGNYASSMLLPHLARLGTANLAHVATTKSLSAENAQQKFGFTTASTDSDAVFNDESLDAIFIVTRHATHAKLVCRALETGKAVFVEKPLALTRDETDAIAEAIIKTGNDRLMVGFNRRFAPLLTAMRRDFGGLGGQLEHPIPGQRREAGRRQLVPQRGGRGIAVRRRGRALHRHADAGGPARFPTRFTPFAARRRATSRPPSGSAAGRPAPSRTSPAGATASRRRRWTPRAAGAVHCWTTSRPPRSGRAAGRRRRRPAAVRTRASAPRWSSSSRPSGPAVRCRSASTHCSRRPGRRSRWARA